MKKRVALWCVMLAALSVAAQAHHSVAMFDLDKTVTVVGTVKEWQYTNPHSWLQILAVGTDGKEEQWAFEAQGPSTLMRVGIKAKTFSPGDKVTVITHPMKDGRTAGLLISVTGPDGHIYKM